MKNFLPFIGLFALLSVPETALAMRCNQYLVYEGDTKYIVLKKCGEPLSKDVYSDPEILFNAYGVPFGVADGVYEVWTYQRSPNEFLYEVLFENGRVRSISANRSNI